MNGITTLSNIEGFDDLAHIMSEFHNFSQNGQSTSTGNSYQLGALEVHGMAPSSAKSKGTTTRTTKTTRTTTTASTQNYRDAKRKIGSKKTETVYVSSYPFAGPRRDEIVFPSNDVVNMTYGIKMDEIVTGGQILPNQQHHQNQQELQHQQQHNQQQKMHQQQQLQQQQYWQEQQQQRHPPYPQQHQEPHQQNSWQHNQQQQQYRTNSISTTQLQTTQYKQRSQALVKQERQQQQQPKQHQPKQQQKQLRKKQQQQLQEVAISTNKNVLEKKLETFQIALELQQKKQESGCKYQQLHNQQQRTSQKMQQTSSPNEMTPLSSGEPLEISQGYSSAPMEVLSFDCFPGGDQPISQNGATISSSGYPAFASAQECSVSLSELVNIESLREPANAFPFSSGSQSSSSPDMIFSKGNKQFSEQQSTSIELYPAFDTTTHTDGLLHANRDFVPNPVMHASDVKLQDPNPFIIYQLPFEDQVFCEPDTNPKRKHHVVISEPHGRIGKKRKQMQLDSSDDDMAEQEGFQSNTQSAEFSQLGESPIEAIHLDLVQLLDTDTSISFDELLSSSGDSTISNMS